MLSICYLRSQARFLGKPEIEQKYTKLCMALYKMPHLRHQMMTKFEQKMKERENKGESLSSDPESSNLILDHTNESKAVNFVVSQIGSYTDVRGVK